MNKKLKVLVSTLLVTVMALSPMSFACKGDGRELGDGYLPLGLEHKLEEGLLPPGHLKNLDKDELRDYFEDYFEAYYDDLEEWFEDLPKGIRKKNGCGLL